ncbi:serine/threonine protein kinase [Streptomyces sp. uw30]|uniref:serine/threonine-protein kinase n=1 Tax=Streptomyces sp. uw30 TaxID=1828179 RepID=UPI0011CDA5CC|nr:serine/threonine-protein kinase [Streptomyces sp. uw30]TXS49314.1 serine/threonine protein kinase [Streptomyces sp. uw30]
MSEADRGPGRRVVDGRFELEARLGGGGMGTVWRARDLVLHRLVAVKEVRPPDRDLAEYDPEGARMLRERVLREARALARIDHPNVVTIHHIVDGGDGTYPWIVMELVSGGSLADRLAQGPMPPAEAARIGRGVLAALAAAHDTGIQHRDVKPANVLLRPDGRPVLTDFGIAAIRETTTNLTATGSIIGTPDFMAPERISGHEGGAASDLWSLAMMLYTAVEGNHPLRRGSTLATLAAVLSDPVPPPVRAGALGDALMSVLVRDPAARPSAAELDRRLADIESGPTGRVDAWKEPTSYPLNPPPLSSSTISPSYPGTSPSSTTSVPFATPAPTAAPTGFGPPVHPSALYGTPQPVTSPVRPARRRTPNLPVLLSVTGTSLAGALVLVWWLVPFGGGSGDSGGRTPSTTSAPNSTRSSTASSGASSTAEAPAAQRSPDAQTAGLLTPDGIRTAIKALEEETGRDRFGDFTVYEDYVSAEVMVDGSDTKYDSYTYRPGRGVEQGIIKGSLSGGDQPVTLDGFNWDAVPALLAEADKKLNVENPDARYLMVRQPNDTFDTPAGLAVYLTDEYGQAGYLEADTKGKVTDVRPAGD